MENNYYFFKAVQMRKHIRLVALPGQTLGEEGIDCTKTIKVGGKDVESIASELSAGSIYYAINDNLLKCTKRCKEGNFYYSVNLCGVLGESASEEAKSAYKRLTAGDIDGADLGFVEEVGSTTKPKVSTFLDELISDVTLQAPSSKKDGFYMSSGDWNLLVRNIKKSVNTMIIGPCGVGKTTAVREACDRLGKKLYVFDMGSMIDPISSLLGVHRLEGGKSVFDYAEFTKAIQEPCVILLDELSRAPLATNNVLFPCLDDRRKLSIEVASSEDCREIKVHPEVCFIATANIGCEYTGTNTIDRALLNRFMPLELTYIPVNEEIDVLTTRCGIDNATSQLIVKITDNIRSLAMKQQISTSLSIRESLMVAELIRDGWKLGDALERVYLPLFEGTKTEGERSVVFKAIASY